MTLLEVILAAQAVFAFVFPLAAGIWFNRRAGAGWRWFWYGAAVFFVLDSLSLSAGIAAHALSNRWMPNAAPPSPVAIAALVAILSALFEECGRYLGYRVLFRGQAKTWSRAVMYGLGHGGLEMMLNKTVALGGMLFVLVYAPHLREMRLAPEQAAAMEKYAAALAGNSSWSQIFLCLDLVSALAMHCCCAVLVLQVFRRREGKWLPAAIGMHGAYDLAGGIVYALTNSLVPTALVSAVGAIISLLIIARMRDRAEDSAQADEPAAGDGPRELSIRSAR